MSYSEQLQQSQASNKVYDRDARKEEIANDIKDVLSDGTVFGDLIAESMATLLSKSIAVIEEKVGEKKDVALSAIKSIASEIVQNGFDAETSIDKFSKRLAEEMEAKEHARDKDFSRDEKAMDMDK